MLISLNRTLFGSQATRLTEIAVDVAFSLYFLAILLIAYYTIGI